MRVVILGAGGHAQVVADILWRMRDAGADVTPVAYLDDNPVLYGQSFLDVPVLGAIKTLPQVAHDRLIVAIGNGRIRQRLFLDFEKQGAQFAIARHPAATIAPDVEIGSGTMICASVVVNTGSTIGKNVILNTSCTVDHHNRIHEHAHIAPGAHLGGNVTIGPGALIGIGAAVLPQRTVGAWSTVGAGAVIVRDLPADVTAVGNPAHIH